MLSSSDTRTPVIVSDKKELRRCVMNEWATYNGLGLILKSNRVEGQPTNLIRQVELGSPAHYAGVLPNDLIIRVNNRYVEFEKFDYVFKLIRDNLKRDKRIELIVINADYIDEFKKKLSSIQQLKKVDLSSARINQFVKNYQSPLVNPNNANQAVSSVNNQPRLCHLLTWSNYDGYGFYVAYTNNGCFVKNVEPNSPAHLGGLRDYDRIIEICGRQIHDASDRNTVNKLIGKRKVINSSTVRSKSSYLSSKSSNNLDNNNSYLDVFVCDPNTYKYLKERRVDISSKNKNLRLLECFTPSEFEIGQKVSHHDEIIENESNKQVLVNDENSVQQQQNIVIKECLIRRVGEQEDQPLGFEMTKRGNTANFVSRVEANSVAEHSGLRQDDFIVELNEKNVENDDNSLLKDKIFKHLNTNGQFKLTIINRQGYEYCRDKNISPQDYIKANGHKMEYYKTPFGHNENVDQDINKPMMDVKTNTRLCVLEKKSEHEELGLSIARYKNVDKHVVSEVIEGSLAHKAGLRQNDCLIEVNGVNVQQMSHTDTINLIASIKKMSNARISFLVEQNRAIITSHLNGLDTKKQVSETQTEFETKAESEVKTQPLNVNKPPSINVYPEIKVCEFIGYPAKTQLGLVITSDDYSHDVVKVNDESPGQRAGLVRGDVILAVNGQSVENNPSSIELMNDFSETKPLRILAASRFAYEWSKLLKISINEKDWPNIKKFSTRWVPEHSQNHTHYEHNHISQQSRPEATRNVEKYYQTINSTVRSNYSNLGRSAVDITADGKVMRLCTLTLDPMSPNPTDSEFGFDLVTKIGANRRIGDYFIDTVDMYSPACCSGLKPGDRLVEVDGHDVSSCTFEQVVDMINGAKQRSRLKLLVYPGMAINYANQNIIPELREEHVISNEHFNQTYTSVESAARSMPDLTTPNATLDHYSKNFKSTESSSLDILRPVPRLCTIYKQDLSNIGFGIQVKNTSQIIPNYLRVNIVNYKSPAYLSGMQSGDLIVEINGRNTLSMSWDEALHYIKTSYEVNGYVKVLVSSEFCYNWLKENQMLATMNSENSNTFSYADYLKNQPRHVPRLCRIRLFPFSKSFGFSIESMLIRPINASKSTSYAHVINRVDKESPAYASRVQKGDRIVEFDGYNVENENQQQLLDRIYQAFVNAKNISLLLVDSETDNFFKSKCIRLHGMLPIVQHITNSTEI